MNFSYPEFSALCRRIKVMGQYFSSCRYRNIITYINIVRRYCVYKNTSIDQSPTIHFHPPPISKFEPYAEVTWAVRRYPTIIFSTSVWEDIFQKNDY